MNNEISPEDKLFYYNRQQGPHGERLATLFRFQTPPCSEYPQIYLPHDSLLNHHSRLIRNAPIHLGPVLSPDKICVVQDILSTHDVPELIEGDASRLADNEPSISSNATINAIRKLLLPKDYENYVDFELAHEFLENGNQILPKNPLSIVARFEDTIDGNFFALAMHANYAVKVGPTHQDTQLLQSIKRSIIYDNKTRAKYRQKILSLPKEIYNLDLVPILEHLQAIEKVILEEQLQIIRNQGFSTSTII